MKSSDTVKFTSSKVLNCERFEVILNPKIKIKIKNKNKNLPQQIYKMNIL
jgi:hypothetical protein